MSPVGYDDELSIVEHLDELRSRLISVVVVFAVALPIAFWQNARLLDIVNRPLPAGTTPATFGVSEAFMSTLTVSTYAALIVTLPVIFWNLYAFAIPAFEDEDRRLVTPILVLAPILFVAGVCLAFVVIIPAAAGFLLGFNDDQFNMLVRAKEYYSFVGMTSIAMGLLFELPLVVLVATRVGITSPAQLKRNRRYALLIIALVAMLLPGTDPVSMILAMVPLLVLFEAGIWLAVWFDRRSGASTPAVAAADVPPPTSP